MIGVSKCSTTTLYHLLGQHPDVWLPRDKGVYHFSSEDYHQPESWQKYLNVFEPAPTHAKIIGESSNTYTQQPNCGPVAERIHQRLGHPKLICMVRDPIARAISHYRHKCLNGGSKYWHSFSEAIEKDPLLATVSSYAMQLKPYHDIFGDQSVLVIVAEQLHQNLVGEMRRVEKYLNISAFDWSPKHLPQANTFQGLQQTVGWQKLVGQKGFRLVRRFTPGFLRSILKPLGPRIKEPPKPTEVDVVELFGLIQDDLDKVRSMLGDRISMWPSLKRMDSENNPSQSSKTRLSL